MEISAITTGSSLIIESCRNTKCFQFDPRIPHFVGRYCPKDMTQEEKLKKIIEKGLREGIGMWMARRYCY